MQISTRTEYALRALLEMTVSLDTPLSGNEICKKQGLPKKYMERLLSNLKAAGMVESLPGAKGGYLLARKPRQINLLQVMQAVEDRSWELSCDVNPPEHCHGKGCGLQPVWQEIHDRIGTVLASYTLEQMLERSGLCRCLSEEEQ